MHNFKKLNIWINSMELVKLIYLNTKDLCRFLDTAIGSFFELETQLILSHEINFIDLQKFNELNSKISELQMMFFGFKQKIINNNKISLES